MEWRELWVRLGDTPTSYYDKADRICNVFLQFDIGTDREEIWHWFEQTFNISICEDICELDAFTSKGES